MTDHVTANATYCELIDGLVEQPRHCPHGWRRRRASPPEGPRPKWSGWVYAYRTFWLDPGADWDEEKTAEFLEIGGTEHPR
jgi:hypothetical protein